MSLLPETLNGPVLIAVITLLVAAGVHYQRGLTYREYMGLMRLKRRVFPLLDRLSPGGFDSFVHVKGAPQDDTEFYTWTEKSERELWRLCKQNGGSPHLISSVKRRVDGHLSNLHFVWYHDDGSQTELYYFEDGAVYAHNETDTRDVEGHLSDGIEPGDPKDVLAPISF
jgi:hypothetical protein